MGADGFDGLERLDGRRARFEEGVFGGDGRARDAMRALGRHGWSRSRVKCDRSTWYLEVCEDVDEETEAGMCGLCGL